MRAFYHKSMRGIYCSVPRRIGSPAPVQYYCSKFAPELQHKHTKKSSKFNHANLYKKARQSPVLVVRDYFIVFFRICKWGNSEYYRKVFASISVSSFPRQVPALTVPVAGSTLPVPSPAGYFARNSLPRRNDPYYLVSLFPDSYFPAG